MPNLSCSKGFNRATTTEHESVDQPRPKVWLTDTDYAQLRDHAGYRDGLVIRLGAECGLRSFEIPQVRPKDIRSYDRDDEEYHFFRVRQGKDTTGNGGKARDAYLPIILERSIRRYVREHEIAPDIPLVNVSPRTVQRIVKRVAKRAADAMDDDDYLKISSHDLRRYFAHTMLVRERMNPRVVMEVGGWDDYQSLEPYLLKPDEGTIIDEFERADRK
ncbi:tyrosine-type recombinase/integrase [Natronococcus wangiae]|uniref:tyrosine-type recombinase/integrase n=1 Tax=Natronococcus wangiae TaxID=3068275 RepID=UPI0031F306C0